MSLPHNKVYQHHIGLIIRSVLTTETSVTDCTTCNRYLKKLRHMICDYTKWWQMLCFKS